MKFNDENAGVRRVEHSKTVLRAADRVIGLNREIQKFGANVYMEPKEVKARVLPEPEVCFEDSTAKLKNGSFNLRDTSTKLPRNVKFVW